MRLTAYISTSRHGIFYFRWPIPASLHPSGLRTDIKLSLGTRLPGIARQLSPMLVCAGQSLLAKASTLGMRYDEIRGLVQTHFRDLLKKFKSRVADTGPLDEWKRDTLTTSRDWARDDPEGFLDVRYPDGVDGLLNRFCIVAGIKETLTPPERKLLAQEIELAFRKYLDEAVNHNASYDAIDIAEPDTTTAASAARQVQPQALPEPAEDYSEVVRRYISEGERANAWAAKTLGEKEGRVAKLVEI